MTKIVIITITLLISFILFSGCIDGDKGNDMFGRTPNYYYSHASASAPYAISGDACGIYYENITVLDKTTEIVRDGFGSRTSYVIVADDGIPREATSYAVYRKLISNNTYTVASTDRQGCGYSEHHVYIGKVKLEE
jgi:hypothetical protein